MDQGTLPASYGPAVALRLATAIPGALQPATALWAGVKATAMAEVFRKAKDRAAYGKSFDTPLGWGTLAAHGNSASLL